MRPRAAVAQVSGGAPGRASRRPPSPRLRCSGSERSDSGSDSQRSPERPGPLHPLSALAALKRKRKKFSDSRRARDERPPAEALQRASSVPARAPPPAPPPPPPAAPPAGSREPLLASLDDDAHKVGR